MRAVRLFELGGIAIAFIGIPTGCSCESTHCNSDLQCRPGLVCDDFDNVCVVPECTSDKQCGRGRLCTTLYKCKEGCRDDDGCSAGFICAGVDTDTCLDDPNCTSGEPFVEGLRTCIAGCRADFECQQGTICAFNTCRTGCRSNADCEPGTYCPAGPTPPSVVTGDSPSLCKPGCQHDAECGPGQVCNAGACHLRCQEASDCGTGGYCAALHALGSVWNDDAGVPLACGAGERCACVRDPRPPEPDAGIDAGSTDSGEDR